MNSLVRNGFLPTTLEVNSLGIGFANISNLYKLDMSDDEYLVVGERHNPTKDPLDIKYNMIVNSDGVAVNASRRLYNTINYNLGQTAGLYVDNNIVCAGNIHAKGLVLDNITIADDINSNVLDSFIKQINEKDQPFQAGFRAYIPDITGAIANVDNIYTTTYLTFGGLGDTFSNAYPLNIVETANNTINNIHVCIKNDVSNDGEPAAFRMGIIGGSNISPAVLSTTEGMPLEFHVSIGSTAVNNLYGNKSIPTYTNGTDLPAMTIDARRNVGIGTNITNEYTYEKLSFQGQDLIKTIKTEYAKLEVSGLSVMKEVMVYDYFTNKFQHLDDIYVRAKGMTLYAGQIGGGIFNDYAYTFFYDLNVNQLLTTRNLLVNETATVNLLNVSRMTVTNTASFTNDVYFNDSVYFQQDLTLNRNINLTSGDLFYNGTRVNILDTEPIFLDPSILEQNNITNNSILVFAQNDVVNISGKNIAFPGRVGVGINDTDSYAEQLSVIKRNSTTFELMLQDSSDEDTNATPCTAFMGHLSKLNPVDNSLIINTNKHPTKLNNIYFYPGKDLDRRGVINNGNPVLTIHQNKRIGINIMGPQYELDVAGHIASDEMFIRRNNVSYKTANFLYSNDANKRYFNIYDPLTDRYCINYNYITSTRDLKGLNVRKGINADVYYENNVLTEQLKAATNGTGFYTNKKIALGWGNEKISAPLQIRNVTTESNNYSVVRIYRGRRGGGRENNADYSGFDICDFDTDLPFQDRNNFRWFMYKNHLNKIGTDDKKRIGPLQFGYMDNALVPSTYGMTMYYTPESQSYHIDVNNPEVDFGFNKNAAMSVYGDLEVHGNINIVDPTQKGLTYKINGINYSEDAIQNAIDENKNTNEVLFGGNKNDIVMNAEKIVLVPNNTTLIGYADDWFLNYANNLQTLNNKASTPLIVYQKNMHQSAARFASTGNTDYIKSSSSIEIGTYNNTYNQNGDIKNMVEFKVSGFLQNPNTLLQLSSFDIISKCYTPFMSFYHNPLRTYAHIGNYAAHDPSTGEVFLEDTTLHIDDMNKYGLQITNRNDAAAINLHRSYDDSNFYYILNGCDDDMRFSITAATSAFDSYKPAMASNTFVIDAIDKSGHLRRGARYGFNTSVPSDTFTIDSVYDEASVKITNRYTESLLFNQVSAITIINSNLQLQVHDEFDIGQVNYGKYMFTWDNDTSTYYTGIKYVMDINHIPDMDNTCNIIFNSYKTSSNFVVTSNIVLNNSASYTTVHNINVNFYSSNLDITAVNETDKIQVVDMSTYTGTVRTFQSSNCLVDITKMFDIIPVIDLRDANLDIDINENDLIKNRIYAMKKTLSIPYPNSIDFMSNYVVEYDYSNVYTIPQYLVPYSVVVASSLVSLSCNLVSTSVPELNSNFFDIHNNIHTYLKQPQGDLIDTVYKKHKTYIDTTVKSIGRNGLYNNIFLITTTSNTILYNDVEYNGNYIANRTNNFNVETSVLVPETIVAREEDRELEIMSTGISIANGVSNIYFETAARTLTNKPLGLIEIYDYTNRIVKRDIHYEIYDDAFEILGNSFVNKIVVSDYYYVYNFDNYYNKFFLNINRIRYMPHLTLMNYIDLDNSPPNDVDKVHKIYSYDGTFELFLERKEGYKDSILRIDEKGDAIIRNSLTTNDLIIDGFIYDKLGNNLLKFLNDDFSNQFSEIYTNKYYLNSSNITIEPTGSNGLVVYSSQRLNHPEINYNIFSVYETDGYNDYNLFSIQKGGKITVNREEDAKYDVDIYGTTYSTEFISEVVYTSNLFVYGSNATVLAPMYNANRVAIENYHEGDVGGDATLKIVSRGQQNVVEVYNAENIALTVSADGLVGVNMLEPSYDLDVFGNTHVSSLLKTSNLEVYGADMTVYSKMLNSNFVKITNSSAYTALKINNVGVSNVLEVLNDDSNVLTASKKGYLGIGMDKYDPEYVVDVCGDVRIDRPYTETFVDGDFYYQFRNDLLLVYDSLGKNNMANYGARYEYVDKRNSAALDGGYMMFEKDNWLECNDLTISGWMRLDGNGSDDVILNVKEVSQYIVMMFPRERISSNLFTDTDGRVIQTTESSYIETYKAHNMFDDLYYGDSGLNEKFGWVSGDGKYNTVSGLSLNVDSYFQDHSTYYGEWIMIDLGESIVIDSYRLFLFNGYTERMPASFRVYASDNLDAWNNVADSSWNIIDERAGVGGWTNGEYKEFRVNGNTNNYRYIALLVHRVQVNGNGSCQITEMEIYGKTSNDTYNDLAWIKNTGNMLSYWIGDNMVYSHEYTASAWFHMLWNVANQSLDGKSFIMIDNKEPVYYDEVAFTTVVHPMSSNIYRNYVGGVANIGKFNLAEFRVLSENLTSKMIRDIYNRPVLTTVEDRVGINIYEPAYDLDVFGDMHVSELLKTSNLWVYGADMTVDSRLLSSNYVKVRNESDYPALKVMNYGSSNALEVFDDNRVGLVVSKGGNVGINTYYPQNDLEVIGDVHVSELLMASNLYVYGADMTVDSRLLSSNFVKITNASAYPALKVANYGSSNVLEVFNEERIELIVDKAGTVGINTYLPDTQYKLDVNGKIHTNNLLKAYDLEVYGNIAKMKVPTQIENTYLDNALKIDNKGAGNVLRIYDDSMIALSMPKKLEGELNRIGVNVLVPRYTLDLQGDAYISELLMTSNLRVYGDDMTVDSRILSSNYVVVRNESELPALRVKNYGSSNAFEVFDDEKAGLIVSKGGHIGIGTYTPQHPFVLYNSFENEGQIYPQISAGNSHTLFLKNDGTVYACGMNEHGELGMGENDMYPRYTPVIIPTLVDIIQVSAGERYSLFLKSDGTVYACGVTVFGNLGIPIYDVDAIHVPTQIPGLNNIKHIVAGSHSLFLKTDGTVYACGNNNTGQIGMGEDDLDAKYTPTLIPGLTDVKQITSGASFTLFLKTNGTVYACGYNQYGQLGMGPLDTTTRFIPTKIPSLIGVKQIAAGSYHTLFLKSDGTVYGCGFNSYAQLGLGASDMNTKYEPTIISLIDNVIYVAAGSLFSMFLKSNNTVYVCGLNSDYIESYGLGLNDYYGRYVPTLIPSLNNIVQIDAGQSHLIFLKSDGTVYGAGQNTYLQLGISSEHIVYYVPTVSQIVLQQPDSRITVYVNNPLNEEKQSSVICNSIAGSSADKVVYSMAIDNTATPKGWSVYMQGNDTDMQRMRFNSTWDADTVEGSDRMVIRGDTGFVGINTSVPEYHLEVVGDMRVSQTIYSSNIVIYGERTTLNTVTYQTEKMEIVSQTKGPAMTIKQIGRDHMFHVYDDDDIVFTINNTRKVGINMMEPAYDLDVTGDVNVRELLQTSNLWVYGAHMTVDTQMINSNFVKVVNDSAYPALKVQNYGSSNALEVFDMNTGRTGLVVTNDGRVGINTYTPDIDYDVEVIGNMHVNSVLKAYEVQVYGGQITLQTPTFNSNYVTIVNESKYPANKINNYGTSNAFEVFNDNKTALIVTRDGHVGVNTYYPKKDFEVIGDANISELLQTSNLWVYGADMTVDTRLLSSNYVKIRNESAYPGLKVENYGSSNAFEVFAFDRTGMVINNEGRVGINTYIAHADVDIIGNVNVSNYNDFTAMKIRSYGTSNALEVFDGDRVGIVVEKGGFVGINTYTPDYDLHIEGTTYSTCLKGDGSNLYNVNFLDRNTSMLVEGSNLYYTAERAGAVAEGSNVHASNLVYNVSNFLKDELDALSRFVDNISLQTGLGNVVVEYDYVPCMKYAFDTAIIDNGVLTDGGDGGNIRYPLKIMTTGSAINNTLTTISKGYLTTAYLWTYGDGSSATSQNSPYLVNTDTNNLQGLLNSFHMCHGFSIHFVMKKNIAVNSNRTCEVLMFANGTNYSNRLIRVVFEGSHLRFYVGSVDFAYTLIDSDVWYIVDLVCKISSDYSTMSLFIYLNGDYTRSMNAINRPYSSLSKASTTGLGFLVGYNNQNTNYETSSSMYLENLQVFAKAISLEEIDGLLYGIDTYWKGSSGFAPNGSNIYFPYGSVGIGTHNPKADFHVVGNALVELGDLYKNTQVNIAVTATPDIWYNFNTNTGTLSDTGTYGMPLTLTGSTTSITSGSGFTSSASVGTYNASYNFAYTWSSTASGVYLSHTNTRNTSLFLDNIDNTGFTMHFVVRRTNGITQKIIPIFFVGMTDSGLNMIYVSIQNNNKLYFKSRSKSKIAGTDTYIEDELASDLILVDNRWYIVDIVFEVSGGTASINMFIRDTSNSIVYTVNKVIDFFEKFDIEKILKTGYVYRWETASGAYDDRFENVGADNLMYAIGYHPKEGAGGTAINISDCSIQDFRIYYDSLVSNEIDKLKTGRTDITEVTTSIRENYGVERWKSSTGYYTANGTKFITYTDGNVGIGTTRPNFSLNVSGTVGISGYSTVDGMDVGNVKSGPLYIENSGLITNLGTAVTGIMQVSAGSFHSLFLHSSGIVYSCGLNTNGQLGIGSTSPTSTPINSETKLVAVRDTTGSAGTQITGIKQIAANGNISLFLHNSGIVYACGNNNDGQLGICSTSEYQSTIVVVRDTTGIEGTKISGILQVAVGYYHTLFLHSSGIVYACGYNGDGQLGIGSTSTSSIKLVPVRDTTGNAGTQISGIKQIAAGSRFSLFLENNDGIKYIGRVYACGANGSGQLGINGTSTSQATLITVKDTGGTNNVSGITMIAAGGTHSLFLNSSGNVFACGDNANRQLGVNLTTTPQSKLVSVKEPTGSSIRLNSHDNQYFTLNSSINFYNIANDNGITFALWIKLESSGGSWWLLNVSGTSGQILWYRNGSSLTISIAEGGTSTISSVANVIDNDWHHIVWSISSTGEWTIWVDGVNKNISAKKTIPNTTFTTRTVGLPFNSSDGYARGNIDDFRIFGKVLTNDDVTLLYNKNYNTTTALVAQYDFNTDAINMLLDSSGNGYHLTNNGATFDPNNYIGGNISGITQIAAGTSHSLFLNSSRNVFACGANGSGQLGINSTSTSQQTLVSVRNTTGNAGTQISGISQISAGWTHSLFLHNSKVVYACGDNTNGRLGINSTAQSIRLVSVLDTTGGTGGTGGMSLYVYNPTNAAGQSSIISNRIAGSSADKVIYSMAIDNSATPNGWSIYMNANDTNKLLRFNDTWNATPGTNNVNDRLVIKGSDGNVGIGTNDPSTYNLFIYKATSTNNLIRIAADGTTTNSIAGVMLTNSATSTTGFSMRYDRTDNKLYFSSQDTTPSYTNRLTIQGSDGNVGIGKTNPGHKLHVEGTLNVTSTTTLGDSLNATGATTLGSTLDVSGVTKIKNVDFNVTDAAGTTNRFSVAGTTGNTTIVGTLDVSGVTKIKNVDFNVTDAAGTTNRFSVAGTTGNTTIVGTLDVSGVTKIKNVDFNVTDAVGTTNRFSVAGTTGNTTIVGTLDVSGVTKIKNVDFNVTDAVGTTNRFLVAGTTGNTTIAGTLTVNGTSASIATTNTASTVNIATGTANNTVNIATNESGTHTIGIGNTKSTTTITGSLTVNGTSASIATTNNASTVNIATGTANNTVNIATNASGTHTIGIGNTNSTTTIAGTLTVNGTSASIATTNNASTVNIATGTSGNTISIGSTSGTNANTVRIAQSNAAHIISIGSTATGTSGNTINIATGGTGLHSISIGNTSSTTTVNGNMIINEPISAAPTATSSGVVSNTSLYVYNNQTVTNNHSTIVNQIYGTAVTNKVVYSLAVGNTSTLTGWSIYRYGDNNHLRFNNTWDATAGTNNVNDKMVILNDGKIGFGTNSPSNNLHIHNTNTAQNVGIMLTDGTTGSSSTDGFYIYKDTFSHGCIWNYENNDLIFGTNNLQRMRIYNDGKIGITGNVGIGKQTPGTALDVNGTVTATTFSGSGSGLTNVPYATTAGSAALLTSASYTTGNTTLSNGELSFVNPSGYTTGRILFGIGTWHTYPGASITMYGNNTGGSSDLGISVTHQILRFDCGSFGTVYGFAFTNHVGIKSNPNPAYTLYINGSGYLAGSAWTYGSDERIKTNIQDIKTNTALQMILALQPKTFNYVDKELNKIKQTYGFIAQHVEDILPEAVTIQTEIIPNIYRSCLHNSNMLIFSDDIDTKDIYIGSNIRLIDNDNKQIVRKILDYSSNSITIDEIIINTCNTYFAYGTEVNDFHSLKTDFIYTVNVAATQELAGRLDKSSNIINNLINKVSEQDMIINQLNSRINKLETLITSLKQSS
jgi:alpha-tubulin suppressor-like RCC1 family protein